VNQCDGALPQDDARSWVALSIAGARDTGPWLRLARAFGGAAAVLGADDAALREAGASRQAVARLRDAWSRHSTRVLADCERRAIAVATFASDDYPALLRALDDPPLVLYWRGQPPASCAPAVAVVGSRRCSDYGRRTAQRIGCEAAERGIVVVSGLARGVDAAAHRGALDGGRTAAVLAGGLERVYPGEHRGLADRILQGGGWLMSEQPPGQGPLPWLFPHRNRILTGLALATVVVEAGQRSGSLASARHALVQGRDVLVVPGPIDAPLCVGTNTLLRAGAGPYLGLEDLGATAGLAEMVARKTDEAPPNALKDKGLDNDEATRLMAVLERGPMGIDALLEATSLDGARVLALLTALELAGLVERRGAGAFGTPLRNAGRPTRLSQERRRSGRGSGRDP